MTSFIQTYSLEPDNILDEENENVHASSRLQV